MLLFFSFTFLQEEIIQAVSFTLLHSLWQGMLLSLIAAGIIFLTKKTSPLLRYNLLTATLVVFIISVAATFSTQLLQAKKIVNEASITAAPINTLESPAYLAPVKSELPVWYKVITFFSANANWIVLLWLLIIGFKFIRFGSSFYNVSQLKKRAISSPGEYWNNRVIELCRQLQINKKVQLLQSGIVKIPAVVGYFKPVILFPVALMASMPLHEVEAILIHELGHIRRKDFLVNMLQNIVEIIFFFNPAVLWISALIKTERENCCDDIAVAHTGNKQDYIKALISFQQFSQPAAPQLAIAFSGEEKYLLHRIKRIIYHNNKTLNNMEKKFLSAGFIMASICFFAFASGNAQQKVKEEKIVSQAPAAASEKTSTTISFTNDTVPSKETPGKDGFSGKINTVIGGNRYILITKNSQINELYVNGKKISDETIGEYKTITDQIMKQLKVNMAQHEKDMAQHKKDMVQHEKDIAEYEINMVQYEEDMVQHEKDMAQYEKDMTQHEKDMAQHKIDMEQHEKDMVQFRILQEKVIEDFISEKIINDKKELVSYKLNAEELIVNGIKQSAAIHKKLKDKYVKSNSWMMTNEFIGVYQK